MSRRGGGNQLDRPSRLPGGYNPLDELTPVQRETVEAALELGYFDIPRGVSMEELAAELDITPNAVSERLRRAERTLLSSLPST